ncbi:hypothetical protein IL306_012917 [Fusarium sp. DS 682]|nr:hypothetical protein IL306_012917 [Fusarium sp. DS 682]
MCIVYSISRSCGNCEAEDIAAPRTETCEAVKEGKECQGKKHEEEIQPWLCPGCTADPARGSCYQLPYDYHPKVHQKTTKEESADEKKSKTSFQEELRKMIGKKST